MIDMTNDRTRHAMIKGEVQFKIFCPISGNVLDQRTAVVIMSSDGERITAIMHPIVWKERGTAVRAALPLAKIYNWNGEVA